MIKYFLFGSKAVSEYTNGNLTVNDYNVFKFIYNETNPIELLNVYSGWMDWCEITEEDYLKYNK